MKARVVSKKIPKLRFSGFSGDWQEKKLGDIAQFSKGVSISKDDITLNGKTEAIRYGELYTTYGEVIDEIKSKTDLSPSMLVLSKANDVIVPASGETHIDIATASCVLKGGVALSGDINIIRSDNNGIFLAYYLSGIKKHDIARLGQGVSVVHLYASNLKQLKLNLPSIKEQQKIADLLSAVDKKVSALHKKKELLEKYKKGVMSAIFSQKIRFKDERGKAYTSWQNNNFDDCFVSISTNNYQIPSSQIQAKGAYAVVDQGQQKIAGFSDQLESKFDDVPVIIFGDHTTYLKFIDFDFVIGADGTKILKSKHDDTKYLYYFLKANVIKAEGYKRHFSILKRLKIRIPSIEEQQKIAYFLTSLDDKIDLAESQLERVKLFKEALLQQMFV